jgi:hypothetical protein
MTGCALPASKSPQLARGSPRIRRRQTRRVRGSSPAIEDQAARSTQSARR